MRVVSNKLHLSPFMENETLVIFIEGVEIKLHQNHLALSIGTKIFFWFIGFLIIAVNGYVIFFILKQKTRTFLDNLILLDCW